MKNYIELKNLAIASSRVKKKVCGGKKVLIP